MSKLTAQDLIQQARGTISQMRVEEARARLNDAKVLFVDVREADELSSGRIPGSLHASRGNLEFYLDQSAESHLKPLSSGKQLIFVCGSGGRAALATKLALEFGYDAICLEGGMKAWKATGGPAE